LLSQLKQYSLNRITGNKVAGESYNSCEITHSGEEKGTREFGVAFVIDKSLKRNILDF